MNKLILFLVSSVLVINTFGCQEAPKTGSETPSTTNEAAQVPAKSASQTTQTKDKTAKLPGTQTTPSVASTDTKKTEVQKSTTSTTKVGGDLKTEVSKKLKQGLPGNKLEVENKEGDIVLKGTATSQEELQKAETLVKEVKGVKNVKVEAKVEPVKKS
ncbi:BON domain-containing protein [Komarekiella sp. 'clone 1']|uniref:BON domain-containing protein n=1 Tax=Komarekiella delphini-convector SJRDD-AB1 TaxID=2593771 RepID=A0AA40SUL3_9NOST|nr:BON domain-containing protein [Komarekiella delphini-convector]MBD6615546.1 BON domain-containing protein [Komarekiella delphini-convector SJRDD-AB1]